MQVSKRLLFGLWTYCILFFGSSSTMYASTLDCSTAININIPVNECQTLLDLYDNTNGPSWLDNTNRDTDTDVATWIGITVAGGNVTKIELSFNELSGTLPASLSGLVFLNTIEIAGNGIGTPVLTGGLPDSRSSLTNMNRVELGGNSINGVLPSSRSSWTNMNYFGASSNQLTGPLPSSRSGWTGMDYFVVESNQINGSLPSSRSSWTSMTYFAIGDNNITGPLPSSRGSWVNITNFTIQDNQIYGTLPSSRSSWTGISAFYISDNLITGFIPNTWYPARPDLGIQYINSVNNCMQTTGYSAGMQSWLTANMGYIPQNDCTVTPPIILSPTSGQVLTTGNLIISGTGQSGNTISVNLSGINLTGIIDGSGLRSFSFNTMTDNSYTISAFQTDSLSTYDSITVTRNFSINTVIPPTPTPTPTPSGGGGGGGAYLQKDNCPAGDNSPSYYDEDCGETSIETTPETNDPTFMEQCRYKDGEFELFKTTMTDIKGMSYEQAVITMLSKCLIHGEGNKGMSYKGEDVLRYGALYKIVYRLVGKPITLPKEQKHWSDIYYTEGKKLGLRKGLSIPKDPNMVVGSLALQKVIHNILDYRSLNNLELERDLNSKTYNSLLVKRGTFALIIEKLIYSQK